MSLSPPRFCFYNVLFFFKTCSKHVLRRLRLRLEKNLHFPESPLSKDPDSRFRLDASGSFSPCKKRARALGPDMVAVDGPPVTSGPPNTPNASILVPFLLKPSPPNRIPGFPSHVSYCLYEKLFRLLFYRSFFFRSFEALDAFVPHNSRVFFFFGFFFVRAAVGKSICFSCVLHADFSLPSLFISKSFPPSPPPKLLRGLDGVLLRFFWLDLGRRRVLPFSK